MTSYRIIVTGSREWTDRDAVHRDLATLPRHFDCRPDQIIIVNGKARGLDNLARAIALELGMAVEDHPADWETYGKAAGHRRNREMVEAGAVGAIAYPIGESRGTRGCMALCEAAGIPVWNRGDPPPPQPAGPPAEIAEFKGKYRFLSNFYAVWIVDADGIKYPTLEHAFQAHKTLDLELRTEIAGLADPAEAKRAGRQLRLRTDWEVVKRDVMAGLLELKFRAGSALADRLLDTGNAWLVEGNYWCDNEWGDCYCGGPRCRARGRNWLGIALMQRREALRIADWGQL
jgi:ribA/ribD-fused uncharacterized protein